MSTPIIELIDSGIRCFHLDDDANHNVPEKSPGYALLTPDKIITGEQARKQAYLAPQQSFNQFWHQLNLSPLPLTSKLARHNADLAFNHLQSLHQTLNQPPQIVFAVPGSFSRDQLGILLGLAKAASINVAGLIDSALLATSQIEPGSYLHLDVQLHQLVITEIDASSELTRGKVETLPTLGSKPVLDCLAHLVADKFIRQYRFDPLHSAQGEQQLHDRLPGWLAQIKQSDETSVELSSPQGNYQLNIDRKSLINALSDRFQSLKKQLDNHPDRQIIISHRTVEIPGFIDLIQNVIELTESDLLLGYRSHQSSIISPNGQIGLITRLPCQQPKVNTAKTYQLNPRVTHCLLNGKAWPLSDKLFFDTGTNSLAQSDQPQPALLHHSDAGWMLGITPDSHTGVAANLQPGDSIVIAGQTLQLIEVP